MDTRFWGPSGWRLLHLLTFTYDPEKQKSSMKSLFETLPYVLPCKFCRASLTDYYKKESLEKALESSETLSKWLYRIHNHVNGKLRKQHLCSTPNPSFSTVKDIYMERIQAGCTSVEFEGWDFLFSIAENHPFSQSSKHSTPMPNMSYTPESLRTLSLELKNRWNLMKPEERIPFYIRFWKSLGPSLPFESWRDAWRDSHPRLTLLHSPTKWKKELWRIRCFLEQRLHLLNQEQFESVCKRLEHHTSGCNASKRSKTCRIKKKMYTHKGRISIKKKVKN
jgi:hypothetical protein